MYRLIGNISRKVYMRSEHKSDLICWINSLATSRRRGDLELNMPEAMLIYEEVKRSNQKLNKETLKMIERARKGIYYNTTAWFCEQGDIIDNTLVLHPYDPYFSRMPPFSSWNEDYKRSVISYFKQYFAEANLNVWLDRVQITEYVEAS